MRIGSHAIGRVVLAGLALAGAGGAPAQAVPRSYEASPDVYKVVVRNANTVVISAVWQPGQRDVMHSHPPSAVYFLTDCHARVFLPDGKSRAGEPRAGNAVLQDAIAAHSFQNVGSTECRMVIVEGP